MAPVHLTRQHMCLWASSYKNAHLCINAREHINGSKHALAGSTRFLLRLFAKIRVWRIFMAESHVLPIIHAQFTASRSLVADSTWLYYPARLTIPFK